MSESTQSHGRIRSAASLVLRRGPQSAEVYLARRNPDLRFFGGYWAFPGGTVSSTDRTNARRVAFGSGATGLRDEPRNEPRNEPPDDAAFVAALFRETLEELGLFLADPQPSPQEVSSLRREWLDDPGAAAEVAASIPGERYRPLLRLLTPPHHPVRYDTQFLMVDASEWPVPMEPEIWKGELIDGAWAEPGRWLERWRAGEILIAPPVLLILHILDQAGWGGAAAHFADLQRGLGVRLHPIFYNAAVQLLPLRTPTLPPATHTNACLIGGDRAYLIDPATPHEDEQVRLFEALDRALGRESGAEVPLEASLVPVRRLEAVLLTHHHPDHVGAADAVRSRFSVPVLAHENTRTLLSGTLQTDGELKDGDRLPLGSSPDGRDGWELEVLFTPGHAAGHLSFFERRYGSLIVGDMVSTLSSILVSPEDGDMALYLASLERLAGLPSEVVFPAHGPAAAGGPRVLRAQLDHRRAREVSVMEAVEAGAGSPRAVVERVYGDVPVEMHSHAELSVRSILQKLQSEGRVDLPDGDRIALP